MAIPTLYGSWPEGSRRTYGWAAILILAVTYFISAILAAPVQIVWIGNEYGWEIFADQARLVDALSVLPPLNVFLTMLLVNFLLWGLMILFWFKVFEKRSFASIGMGSERAMPRFLGGLLIGVVLVGILFVAVLVSGLITGTSPLETELPDVPVEEGSVDLADILPLFGMIIVFFLFQGGMEEVVVRGWLMSTLSARWGVKLGVVLSSLVFALLHFQHVVTNGVIGLVPVLGIFFTGLFFALLAVYQRSIWGAFAAHGAFNATAILGPVAGAIYTQPGLDPEQAVIEIFEQAAGLTSTPDIGPEGFAQSLVFAALSLILVWRLSVRAKR